MQLHIQGNPPSSARTPQRGRDYRFLYCVGTEVAAKSTNTGAKDPGQGHGKPLSRNRDGDGQQNRREGLALWQV